MSRAKTTLKATFLTSCLTLATTPPTHAITINTTFDNTNSLSPAFDPTGANLTALFNYADTFYTDVFEQSGHTLNITFRYANLTGGNIGLHTWQSEDANQRENSALIRIDPTIGGGGWWIDPTPANDNEFTMTQTLWRNLTTGSLGQRADWYNRPTGTNPPDTFEAGFTGAATVAGGAQGATDMLSVVLHEVGHALGMSAAATKTQNETGDGDYDYYSEFVGGATLAVETANNSSDDNLNIAHLENTVSLMTPAIPASTRRRPSHTDLLAMAVSNDYGNHTVDLPRKEFYGTGGTTNWNNEDAWSGHHVPDGGDDVFIRDANGPAAAELTAGLTALGRAENVFISEGNNLDLNDEKLDVDQDVFITDTSSDIFINTGGELEADEVFIQPGADINMNGNGLIDVRRLTIEAGTSTRLEGMSGASTIDVSQRLTVNGEILGSGDSTLTFTSVDADAWNLDGAGGNDGDGVINASNGNLNFTNSAMSDTFNGTMRAGAGHFITLNFPWAFGSGTIDLNGGADFANRARINGGLITMSGGLIDANGVTHINAPITINGGTVDLDTDDTLEFNNTTNINGGTVSVGPSSNVEFDNVTNVTDGTFTLSTGATINFDFSPTFSGTPVFNTPSSNSADGRVNINGTTTYAGGTININGFARQNGNATVSADTTINAETFDFDGSTDPTWTINKELTINADLVDTVEFFSNTIDSTININNPGIFLIGTSAGGVLEVNLPVDNAWLLNGTTNLDGSVNSGLLTFIPTMIDGSLVVISGTLNMQDRGSIGAQASVLGTVNTSDAASLIRFIGGDLTDTNTMSGGSINGPGTVGSIAGRALVGHGTINTDIDFNDTAELRANGDELTINGDILDVGTLGTASDTGVLNVTNNWNTNVTDLVELQGGSIIGNLITNPSGKTITGHGTISSTQVNNDGTISADGGELILDFTSNPNLDGTTGNGIIEAVTGDLTVVDPVTDVHNGIANVGGKRTMTFQQGWTLAFDGVLNLNGGDELATAANVAGSNQILAGTINVNKHAAFQIPTTFSNSSTTNLPDADDVLHLQADSDIFLGATFSGLGTIINHAGFTLSPDDNVNIAVNLSNEGTVVINGSTLFGGNFTNQATGLFTGFGVLSPNQLNNKGTISASTSTITIDTASNPDLDGSSETGVINATTGNLTIADPLADVFNGTANVGNSRNMTFQQGWTLAPGGKINLNGGLTTPTSATVTVPSPNTQTITGLVVVTGYGTFNAKTDIGPSAMIGITNPADRLFLNGNSAVNASAVFAGAGTLVNNAGKTLDPDDGTNIAVKYQNDGTTLITGGKLTGADFTNSTTGLFVGFGTLTPNQLINNGKIAAKAGTLTLDYDLNPDLDGTTESGVIEAINGNIVVADPVTDIFDGTANVGNSRTLSFQQGWVLTKFGDLNLNGGPTNPTAAIVRVPNPHTQNIDGAVNVTGYGVFNGDSIIRSNADIEISNAPDRLLLDGDTVIVSGANFTGSGSLVNVAGNTLTLANGAAVGVNTINNGTIELGASPGLAKVASLDLNNASNLHIEVFVPSPATPTPAGGTHYDQLIVTGPVQLDGTLTVSPNIASAPILGTGHEVLTYDNRSSMFDDITGTIINPNIALAPLFTDTNMDTIDDTLILEFRVPGDLNLDNTVSVADLATFALFFDTEQPFYNPATNTNSWELGDFNTDGAITVTDLSLLALNFGFDASDPSTPATGLSLTDAAALAGIDPSTIPEPATATLWIIAATATLTRRNKQT